MSKPAKYVVAVVLSDRSRPGQFLMVKRPDDDPDLRGAWGLPAVTIREGELPEEAAIRACREKLACHAVPKRFLGMMYQKRNNYDIFLMDIEMALSKDFNPNVLNAHTKHTAYADQRWSSEPMDLMPSARHGSCCSSVFLTDKGLLDREAWINSLEGSDLVG